MRGVTFRHMNSQITPAPSPAADSEWVENVPFDQLTLGQSASLKRVVRPEDLLVFAALSGDANPAHLDPEYAQGTFFKGVIAHGMFGAALISAVLGMQLPGPGAIYMSQSLKFLHPVHIGDELTARVTITELMPEKRHVSLECVVLNQKGEAVISGEAMLLASARKIRRPRVHLALPEAPARLS